MSRIKVVRTHIPKCCYCPSCGLKQPFKKYHEHWKTVKDFNPDKPNLIKAQVIPAARKSRNLGRLIKEPLLRMF